MPSSVIRRFSYDEPRRRLRITFTSGDVYEYDGVPPEVNAAFREAFSKGQFFGPAIRIAGSNGARGRGEAPARRFRAAANRAYGGASDPSE